MKKTKMISRRQLVKLLIIALFSLYLLDFDRKRWYNNIVTILILIEYMTGEENRNEYKGKLSCYGRR